MIRMSLAARTVHSKRTWCSFPSVRQCSTSLHFVLVIWQSIRRVGNLHYQIYLRTNSVLSFLDLLLLNTLQLSRLAMCHFNPLRYCLPPVATAFAGVTRTYQLAYCHTVLERNARRKLATIYGHERLMPEETLDTFFPFDPYILPL